MRTNYNGTYAAYGLFLSTNTVETFFTRFFFLTEISEHANGECQRACTSSEGPIQRRVLSFSNGTLP